MEAGRLGNQGRLAHEPGTTGIDRIPKFVQAAPRPIRESLLQWPPQMFRRHEFRRVGQREHQLNPFRTHDVPAAMPPGVVDVQHDMRLVIRIDSRFEQLQCRVERGHIDAVETQQVTSSRPGMNEAVDVQPGVPVAVGNALAFPCFHPGFAEDAFRAVPCLVLTPELDPSVRVLLLPLFNQRPDFFCCSICSS